MAEPRILVVNHPHSVVCGVHDLGLRIYNRLKEVSACGYAECGSVADYEAAVAKTAPSHVIVNHRDDLTPWTTTWSPPGVVTIAVAHNYEPGQPGPLVERLCAAGFDRVLMLEPDIPTDPRIIATVRPLPEWSDGHLRNHPPRIGSFGFAFPHKGFDLVAHEVATLDRATFMLHMPEAYFNGRQGQPVYGEAIFGACTEALTAHHAMHWTSEHLPPERVVQLLAANDVNCLLYHPGQPEAGLSSALDYLIAAGRPMLLSSASMFRHVGDAAAWWPDTRLTDVLDGYEKWEARVKALRDEWGDGFAGQLVEQL
jgi:hypothetical protein